MSSIALPSWFKPDGFALRLSTVQRAHASPFGGSEQVVDLLNDRWVASVSLPPRMYNDAGDVEAFVASMRGMTNTVNLHHFVRTVPRGTMRGSPLVVSAVQGAAAILIAAPALSTLLAGDMLGIGGLLLQVQEDCIADGDVDGSMRRCTVPIVNRLRRTVATGTAVVWNRPTAVFRLMSPSAVQYVPGYADGVSLDFSEAVA